MEALIALAALFFLGTPFLALYASARVRGLDDRVRRLSQDVDKLGKELRATQRLVTRSKDRADAPSAARVGTAEEASVEAAGAADPQEQDAKRTTEVRFGPDARPAASRSFESSVAATGGGEATTAEAPDKTEGSADADGPVEAEAPAEGKGPSIESPDSPPDRATKDRQRPEPEPERGTPRQSPPKRRELDLETLIGSTWLLRVGLGILAIALALFARSIAPQLSAGAKVAIAYAGSIGLFAVGKYYEDRLEKFARPVMAGGLSFGFFVAFAAHFVPAMQAVSMPVSIVWMVVSMCTVLLAAERWKSEHTAVLAIILGHLSAQVVAGDADLYSLVMIAFLGCTAIVLLLRHSWVALGVVGVGLSYGAHLLWLFAERAPIDGDRGFWLSLAFLSSYYFIFLIADVLWWRRHADEPLDSSSKAARAARALGPTNLVLYASLASFVYFISGATVESIEWFFLTLGAFQGVLAWIYRHTNHRDFVFYPAFGTVLWTLGMFAAFDAFALNLVLAVQALLLLVAAHRTRLWIFHALAQAALLVAFLQYATGAGAPNGTEDLALFIGGLAVGCVYLLKASLEEIWYGDGSPSDWFGDEESGGSPGFLGTAFTGLLDSIAPVLAPLHAVLGGVVLARESLLYFGGGTQLASFLTAVSIGVLAMVLVRRRPALLFTVTTIAVSIALAIAASPASEMALSVAVLILAATTVVYLGPQRLAEHDGDALAHGQAIAVLALVASFVLVHTAPPGTVLYVAWMGLPLLLLGFQFWADRLAARRLATFAAVEPEVAPDPSAPPPPMRESNHIVLAGTMYVACALLTIMLTEQWFGRAPASPIWIAFWACAGLGAARLWRSLGFFTTGYAVLVLGYAFLLNPGLTLAVWWAGLIVTLVPFLIAVEFDRRLDETLPPDAGSRRNAGLALTFLPYAIGLALLTGYSFAQLPDEWAFLGAALVAVGLLLCANRIEMPRGVVSIVAATLAWQLLLLAAAEGLGRPAAALLPLLLFVAATLAIERMVHAWVSDERDHPLRNPVMTALVVLATLGAVTTLYASQIVGPTWATAGWSVLGGSMMAFGFAVKSAVHRRVALVLLGACIVRVFAVDTIGLSDSARIGAFLVLGLILIGIALLYTRFSEELKSWL